VPELYTLPLWDIAADDAAMLLWCPDVLHEEGIHLLRHWGFRYVKIAFTWIKTRKDGTGLVWGMGHYTRANPEFVLLGMRGSLKRKNADVHSVVKAPRIPRNGKPDEVRTRIERLFGRRKRIELFAIQEYPGWVCLGNEIDGRDIRCALKDLL
jgi:N6-adenosine-specific RNA methylase IME4